VLAGNNVLASGARRPVSPFPLDLLKLDVVDVPWQWHPRLQYGNDVGVVLAGEWAADK